MSSFFYWQARGGEDSWQEALASSRESVINTKQPRYVTVLDLSELITPEFTREQFAGIRYSGPLYFDWDAEDIRTTISKVNQFCERLQELGVDPYSVRWYATGGRGFHAELPQGLFLPKVTPKGAQYLPLIYREMAFELFTDSMDMRVYSAKKGRMWRTPNVQRENKQYKVPITVDEMKAMTPEAYVTLCAAPRPKIEVVPAVFNGELGLIYEKARLKIETGAKKKSAGTRDVELLKRFKGDWPPTLKLLMTGEALAEKVGFHQLAMQVAITANAIGKSEEDTLAAAAGVIENHVSDGNRYNTPARRKAELSRLYHYTKDNVCYSYGKGALKVLCKPGIDTADLDGMPDDVGERIDQQPESEDGETRPSLDLRGGIEMRETGIYKKDQENGVQMISDISFKDVRVLLSLPAVDRPAELWGFEAEILLQGKPKGRQQIDMQVFLSKQRYQEFSMRNMGVMKGNDNDVASLSTILRDLGVSSGNVAYVTKREGLDMVTRPDSNPPVKDLLWVETSGVFAKDTTVPYMFRPMIPSGSIYQSDMRNAPPLEGTDLELEFFEHLFQLNDPAVIAPILGWLTSCYHRMMYESLYRQFPLCQVFGQAGSGKTKTLLLLSNLHFYSTNPLNLQCSQLTPYYLQIHAAASASIPMILDEYKPRQMPAKMRETLPNVLRAAYNNGAFGKGGEGDGIGQGWKSISRMSYSAPIVFIGEALETESAIMERTVAVPVSKAGIVGRSAHLKFVEANTKILSSAGRSILDWTLAGLTPEVLQPVLEKNREQAAALFKPDTLHRVVFNMAVVLTGFDFFSQVLRKKFGTKLDEHIESLRFAILRNSAEVSNTIMAEASKVMDILAFMSNNEDRGSPLGLKYGPDGDYVESSQGGVECIDLSLQKVWVKYVTWCKHKGQQPLYDNLEAFRIGLQNYAPMIEARPVDTLLTREGALVKVFRFSLAKLADEGVQSFKFD